MVDRHKHYSICWRDDPSPGRDIITKLIKSSETESGGKRNTMSLKTSWWFLERDEPRGLFEGLKFEHKHGTWVYWPDIHVGFGGRNSPGITIFRAE